MTRSWAQVEAEEIGPERAETHRQIRENDEAIYVRGERAGQPEADADSSDEEAAD